MIAWLSIAFAGTFDAVDAAGSPAAKADALLAIVEDPKQEAQHAEAWARLQRLAADQRLGVAAQAERLLLAVEELARSAL